MFLQGLGIRVARFQHVCIEISGLVFLGCCLYACLADLAGIVPGIDTKRFTDYTKHATP